MGKQGGWMWLALALNGFAFVTVNYLIYTARWQFIARNGDSYRKPPTISRAISDPVIGEPFALWITLAGIGLVVSVAILAWHYLALVRRLERPGRALRLVAWTAMPLIVALQVAASLGMHWLSAYRFPNAHEMHMMGSYTFFLAQAMVIVLFTVYNAALLCDRNGLLMLELDRRASRRWVALRLVTGLLSIAIIIAYFTFFTLKDSYEYPDYPVLYMFYVSTEPMVITSFLLVLMLCHGDLHRQPRRD